MSDYAAPDRRVHPAAAARAHNQYPSVRGPQPQQQVAPVRTSMPINAAQPAVAAIAPARKTAAERLPEHAKGIEFLVPLQKRRVTWRITGTPAQMESGTAHVQRLGDEVVETWRQATSLKNRHQAQGSELEGDPTKTVIKSMRVCTRANEFDVPLDLDIDYFMPHSAVAGATSSTVHIPPTKGVPLQDSDYVVQQTTHTVTDRMLGFEGLMEGAEMDIIPDRNPEVSSWNIRAWDSQRKSPTFAVVLLRQMLLKNQWPGQASIAAGVQEWFANPNGVEQMNLPKYIVQDVEQQIIRGQREIKSSMADLNKLTATFRPTYGSWTRNGVSGVDVGSSITDGRAADNRSNQVTRTAYVECEFTYGMLKSKKAPAATGDASF